ncbi:MAG: hypothetical protein ACXVES_07455 [Actinomycetota bacterium]
MRVMQIDEFLEMSDGSGSGPAAVKGYDWPRLIKEGRAARLAADDGAWRIGDLAALVERRYASGALKRFAEEIGESFGSVRRFRWVAGAYDQDARARFAALSFSHFQTVASLDDRTTWLERAQRGSWSVERLATTARGSVTTPVASHVALRARVEATVKKIEALAATDDRTLAKAARAGLADAVEDLAANVERLRARLVRVQKRSIKLAR